MGIANSQPSRPASARAAGRAEPRRRPNAARVRSGRVAPGAVVMLTVALWAGPGLPVAAWSSPAAALAPEAAATAFDPCAAANAHPLRTRLRRAQRVVFALASGYGVSHATVSECGRRADGRWVRRAATAGRVGAAGFAAPGRKREGDRATPSGVFTLGVGFGKADPGSGIGYLTLTPRTCWGSTVGAPTYNTAFTGTCRAPDERMWAYVDGAYRQGLVIDHNTRARVPGWGSAIFLHVSTRAATAGCVSVPEAAVTRIMRAARPGDLIVMGVASAVFGARVPGRVPVRPGSG